MIQPIAPVARIIDGAALDPELVEEVGYGPVAKWLNGLGSLESALSDPEFIEEDEETA